MSEPLAAVRVGPADLRDPVHARSIVDLLDHYARDPMGGSTPLTDYARGHLVERLRERGDAIVVLAHDGEAAVGLAICFEGFSTFAAKPLVNVHDLVVLAPYRGRGVGRRLLEGVESIARERGACKLTLEVLEGNARARAAYARAGFTSYTLDPTIGHALFLSKPIDYA